MGGVDNIYDLQFWRLGEYNQGVGKIGFFLRTVRERSIILFFNGGIKFAIEGYPISEINKKKKKKRGGCGWDRMLSTCSLRKILCS